MDWTLKVPLARQDVFPVSRYIAQTLLASSKAALDGVSDFAGAYVDAGTSTRAFMAHVMNLPLGSSALSSPIPSLTAPTVPLHELEQYQRQVDELRAGPRPEERSDLAREGHKQERAGQREGQEGVKSQENGQEATESTKKDQGDQKVQKFQALVEKQQTEKERDGKETERDTGRDIGKDTQRYIEKDTQREVRRDTGRETEIVREREIGRGSEAGEAGRERDDSLERIQMSIRRNSRIEFKPTTPNPHSKTPHKSPFAPLPRREPLNIDSSATTLRKSTISSKKGSPLRRSRFPSYVEDPQPASRSPIQRQPSHTRVSPQWNSRDSQRDSQWLKRSPVARSSTLPGSSLPLARSTGDSFIQRSNLLNTPKAPITPKAKPQPRFMSPTGASMAKATVRRSKFMTTTLGPNTKLAKTPKAKRTPPKKLDPLKLPSLKPAAPARPPAVVASTKRRKLVGNGIALPDAARPPKRAGAVGAGGAVGATRATATTGIVRGTGTTGVTGTTGTARAATLATTPARPGLSASLAGTPLLGKGAINIHLDPQTPETLPHIGSEDEGGVVLKDWAAFSPLMKLYVQNKKYDPKKIFGDVPAFDPALKK